MSVDDGQAVMEAEQPIAMAITALTTAATQTRTRGAGTEQATTEPVDFAELACHVLTAVAANAGGVERLLAGRPGSWEADLVRQIIHNTAGDHLDRHRTLPIRLGVDVAGAFDDFGLGEMAAREEDAAVEATFADSLTEAGQARAEALADAIGRLRHEDEDAYLAAYRQVVERRAAELGITVPVEVTRNGDYEGDTGDDETVAGLHAYAREHTPLPMIDQPPASSAEAITEIIRLLGRTYTARAQAAIDTETAEQEVHDLVRCHRTVYSLSGPGMCGLLVDHDPDPTCPGNPHARPAAVDPIEGEGSDLD